MLERLEKRRNGTEKETLGIERGSKREERARAREQERGRKNYKNKRVRKGDQD